MRIAVLVASLMNLAAVSVLNAQCQLSPCQMAQSYVVQSQPVQGCCGQRSVVYPSVSSSPCYNGCSQTSYAVVSTPCGSVVSQPQVVYGETYSTVVNQPLPLGTQYQPYTAQPHVVQQGIVYSTPLPTQNSACNNCNCGAAAQYYPQPDRQYYPQSTASAQQGMPFQANQGSNVVPRNPFSLSGHVRPSTDENALSTPCLMQFLRCCKYGGPSCAYDYYLCSQATGEQMKHRICPGETPVIED